MPEDEQPECYIATPSAQSLCALAATPREMPTRWGLDSCCSVHATPDRSVFRTYRALTPQDNCRSIGGVGGSLAPVGKGLIELKINVGGKCRLLRLDDVLHIPGLPMNLISQGKLMRSGCPIKIVPGGIEIGVRGITAWLVNNDIYRFNIWETHPKEPPMSVPVPKQVAKSSRTKPGSSRPRALVAANPIDRPIISPAPVKRPREVDYESEVSDTSASSCNSDSSTSSIVTSGLESDSGMHGGPRKKRKLNAQTVAYYHRCLGYAGDVEQLEKYGINLSKEVSDRAPCISCVIKKIQQVRYTSHIRPGRRRVDLIHSDIG